MNKMPIRAAWPIPCLLCVLCGGISAICPRVAPSPKPQPCYRLNLVPNDPFYENVSDAETDFQRWMFDGIDDDRNLNAQTAWGLTVGRPDVVVAVIDSGVLLAHPDLRDNIWINEGEIPANGLDDDRNGLVDDVNGWDFITRRPNPNPDFGDGIDNDGNGLADEYADHGTFLAGLVAARGDNRVGVAGTTWRCRVMALRAFTSEGEGTDPDIALAVRYAAANGADIINLGFSAPFLGENLSDAIRFAQSRNVLVVAPAGNDNEETPLFPARVPGVISVGATGSGFQTAPRGFNGQNIGGRAPFSNFGPAAVDAVAPGFALSTSFLNRFQELAGEGKAGTPVYAFRAGTSVSGAIVSGLAALIVSRAKDLGLKLTADQIRRVVLSTTVSLPDDPEDKPDGGDLWAGRGRVEFVDALNAVASAGAPPLVRGVSYDAGTERMTLLGDNFVEGKALVLLDAVERPAADHRYKRISSGLARKITVRVPPSGLPAGRPIQVTVRNPDGQTSAPFTFVR